MATNGLIGNSMDESSFGNAGEAWASRIDPATWAFSIWALIYTLIFVFVIYQALPDSCCPRRNNDLIYNKIAYLFPINMVLNAGWLFSAINFTDLAFIFGLIIIIALLVVTVIIMDYSGTSRVNVTELIVVRIGFSIYAGWLTTATILNTVLVLISAGLTDDNLGIDESLFSCLTMIAGELIYMGASYRYKNPAYACVFIWVLIAIRDNQAAYPLVTTTTEILLAVHGCWIVFLTTWMILDKINNAPEEFKGLLY